MKLAGIHRVASIAADPAANAAFYTEVLGLRLVRKTVNFDDPSTGGTKSSISPVF